MADLTVNPIFNALDRRVARLVAERSRRNSDAVELIVAITSYLLRQGHVCLDLNLDPPEEVKPFLKNGLWSSLPQLVKECPVVADEDVPDQPLILSKNRKLYFHRYWFYESELLQAVVERCRDPSEAERVDTASAESRQAGIKLSYEQRRAVTVAMRSPLTLISGGPGTGKTTTILSLILQNLCKNKDVEADVALAAPTGKAAQRVQESLEKGLISTGVKPLNLRATTVHRLLGYKRFSSQFMHDKDHPLPFGLVIIDEASMLDLPLFAKLIGAIGPESRLVLLGDRHQLASVEAGSIFGDLVEGGILHNQLKKQTIDLRQNFRFAKNSPIYRLCQTVKMGDADQAIQLLKEKNGEIRSMPLPSPNRLKKNLANSLLAHYKQLQLERDPPTALNLLDRYCVLSPVRKGPYGVEGLNRTIESLLKLQHPYLKEGRHYHGKPILITENNYDLNLFNGEMGMLLASPHEPEHLQAWFYGESRSEVRKFPISALPSFETAYAITVHKSQGSEYEKVYLILPPQEAPILTRELIYTGISRSRNKVEIWANTSILKFAINRPTRRSSGIADRLRNA